MITIGMIIGVIVGFLLGFYTCTLLVMKDRKELKRIMETALEKERKTGQWVTEEIGLRSYATKCSVCGTVLHKGHNFDNAQAYKEYVAGLAPYDKFCHECGAKMEAGK